MIMSDTVFRVHPAIGIGRVGDSQEFYVAPVTAAGTIGPSGLMGGLPIKPGTEDTPITADDFRDKPGNVKRQAARFRVYAYPVGASGKYPSSGGTLVTIGSTVGGKKVADIVWTVHLANKKLNNYSTVSQCGQFRGMAAYENPAVLELRNDPYKGKSDKSDPVRLRELFIDPGPRAIKASAGTSTVIAFDATTPATYAGASTSSLSRSGR
jgi:L-Lysine epsilon oxidase N-terminal